VRQFARATFDERQHGGKFDLRRGGDPQDRAPAVWLSAATVTIRDAEPIASARPRLREPPQERELRLDADVLPAPQPAPTVGSPG